MEKKFLIVSFLFNILLLVSGCDFERRAMYRPLTLEIKGNDVCIYTNNTRSFLGENDEDAWYLLYANRSDNSKEKNFERKFFLKDHKFPFKKEDCLLIPISLLELNKPYSFNIDTGKSFSTRACILREGNHYRVKKVTSTENCDG